MLLIRLRCKEIVITYGAKKSEMRVLCYFTSLIWTTIIPFLS